MATRITTEPTGDSEDVVDTTLVVRDRAHGGTEWTAALPARSPRATDA